MIQNMFYVHGPNGSLSSPVPLSCPKGHSVEAVTAEGPLGPASGAAALRNGISSQVCGVRVCTPVGRRRQASSSEEVEDEALLATDPKRSKANPKFLPQEVGKRGVLP